MPEGSRYCLRDCDLQVELCLLKQESPVLLRPLSADRPGEGPEALIPFAQHCWMSNSITLASKGQALSFWMELCLSTSSSGLPSFTTEMFLNSHSKKNLF